MLCSQGIVGKREFKKNVENDKQTLAENSRCMGARFLARVKEEKKYQKNKHAKSRVGEKEWKTAREYESIL